MKKLHYLVSTLVKLQHHQLESLPQSSLLIKMDIVSKQRNYLISVLRASTVELKSPENVESFDGSFKGHSNYIIDIALSRDYLYSCSGDKTVKKWDLNTGKTV